MIDLAVDLIDILKCNTAACSLLFGDPALQLLVKLLDLIEDLVATSFSAGLLLSDLVELRLELLASLLGSRWGAILVLWLGEF